jgi:hydrogenase maturation protease
LLDISIRSNLYVKTLVVGLGNPILCDDGIGIYVAMAAKEAYGKDGVDFVEASVGGLRLLSVINGYERVILVDAIMTPDGRPGEIYRMGPNELCASLHADCSHDMSLPAAMAFGRKMGMLLPSDEEFIIIAIEVEEVRTFGEECTPAVEAAIPQAVEAVLAEL